MPDYDVEAVALSSPPASAVMTPYRPAVLVRNNGVHDALASGYIRIYSAGLLIFTTEVYSGTIAPGATGLAQAVDYWTPPAEGKYIANGYVSCPLDQYEPNNNLGPSTFTVTGGPTPPPPTVPIHAAQHEEGGTDEVSIDGLKGRAADRQDALAHAASHQASGTDQINVSALIGELASPQTPKTHSNAYHDPVLVTESELSQHETASTAHSLAANLANRETSGPDSGFVKPAQLSTSTEVPDAGDDPVKAGLRLGHTYGPVNAVHHAAKHAPGGLDPIAIPGATTGIERGLTCTPAGGQVTLVTCELTAAQAKPGTVCHFEIIGNIHVAAGLGQQVDFTLYHQGPSVTTPLVTAHAILTQNKDYTLHFDAMTGIGILAAVAALIHGELTDTSAPATETHIDQGMTANLYAPAATSRFYLACFWTGGSLGSSITITNAIALGVVRP